ncbi:MAG: hypothetical protein IPL65_18410 [Lewinellaceae bacterium]|nr:hypothetical protein [Lewinellaceae bacterium]
MGFFILGRQEILLTFTVLLASTLLPALYLSKIGTPLIHTIAWFTGLQALIYIVYNIIMLRMIERNTQKQALT